MELRERLVAAAAGLVTSGGLEALSVRAVAAACRVSIGAVQHHFPTKSALLMALLDAVADDVRAAVPGPAEDSAPEEARARLVALAELLGGAVDGAEGPIKVWIAFVARAVSDEEVALRHRVLWSDVEAALARLLRAAGASEGDDRAAVLLAALDGLAIARALEPDRMPPERCRLLVHRAVAQALSS